MAKRAIHGPYRWVLRRYVTRLPDKVLISDPGFISGFIIRSYTGTPACADNSDKEQRILGPGGPGQALALLRGLPVGAASCSELQSAFF